MSADHIDVASSEVGEPSVAALATVGPSDQLVRPAASLQEVENAFQAYQDLYARLLVADDFQQIGKRRFAKKSAWRKLAVAFGVTFELIDRVYERDGNRIIRAEIVARASAPNGRFADGLGACDLFERCCQPGCSRKHTHCKPDCGGAVHFSNPQHDLPATAETRAKNRAASDLFGMGEVSAEELNTADEHPAPAPPAGPAFSPAELVKPRVDALSDQAKAELLAWWKEQGLPKLEQLNPSQAGEVLVRIGRLG